MENNDLIQSKNMFNAYKINFILLIIGRLVGDLGSAALKFGISLYVLDITGSAGAFSMVLAFSILPGVFINILAGVYIDKGDKKKFIVFCDILSGIAVLIFFAVFKFYPESMGLFIIYSITLGVIQAIFLLALNASIPEIVNKENVARANSAFQSIGAITNLAGPVVGAIAYSSIGIGNIFVICGIAFIIAGSLEIFLKFNKREKVSDSQKYFDGLKEVFVYLNKEKGIKFILLIVTAINFIIIPLISLVLPYINYNQLKVSGLQLSIIQGSWTGGMIVAAIFVSMQKSTNNIFKKVFIILQVQAVSAILWFFPKIPVFLNSSKETITLIFSVILVVGGTLNAVMNITAFTFLQLKVPEEIRARIFGVVTTASLLAAPLGMGLYGVLLENFNWMYITIISGFLLMLIGIYGNRNKDFKDLIEDQDEIIDKIEGEFNIE